MQSQSSETDLLDPVSGNITAAAACAAIMRALASSGLGATRSPSTKLSQQATVATQTDPWSDDCRLSMFGDDYDDAIERDDNVSEHIYQLYDRCPTTDAVPLYDYILHGGSETDDDGYDVIDECYGGVELDNSTSKKDMQSIVNDNFTQSAILQRMFSPALLTSQTSFPVNVCRSLSSSFAGQQLSSNQSAIRLGVESRRPTFSAEEITGSIASSSSPPLTDSDARSRRTHRGRLVPTMGTRLRSVRHRTASDAGSSCSPIDAQEHVTSPPLPTTEWWTQEATIMSTSSNSEGEQSVGGCRLADVSSASSLQSASWSSDEGTAAGSALTRRVRFRPDPATASDSIEEDSAEMVTTVHLPEADVPATPSIVPDALEQCLRISANACNDGDKVSPVRLTPNRRLPSTAGDRKSNGVEVVGTSGDGTRRRFIYENYADVMYTNEANLAHTIMVQQRLFQQLIADNSGRQRDDEADRRNNNADVDLPPPLPARRGLPTADIDGGVSSRRRVRSRPTVADNRTTRNNVADDEDSSKWVVRRRKDGTRYVTRSRQDDAENTNKSETKLRHSQKSDESSKMQLHVSKHRRVTTTTTDKQFSTTRYDNQRVTGAAAELTSRTMAIKSGQHHPILAVVTI